MDMWNKFKELSGLKGFFIKHGLENGQYYTLKTQMEKVNCISILETWK